MKYFYIMQHFFTIFANKYLFFVLMEITNYDIATNGYPVVSFDEITELRDADSRKADSSKIIAQVGAQEKLLSSNADITIFGGARGGGKSYSLLLETLNDVYSPKFKGIICRNAIDDLSDLVDTSQSVFGQFGEYNRSKGDMTWNFANGGSLKFSFYAGNYDDFVKRFQGKQFSFMAVDEITQIEYKKFKYMLTDNRNTGYLRNRFIGTCNPDPESWVARFIDWWIDEDGSPNKERDGKIRYCFMDGNDVSGIVWGDSRDEVYEKCKATIDRYWRDEYKEFGDAKQLFIKSVCFIHSSVYDNKQLLRSSPEYLGTLANRSEEERARDLDGNWKYKEVGDEIVKYKHMEELFNRPIPADGGRLYASCDIAVEGGDNLVLCLWQGDGMNYLKDIYVTRMNAKATITAVKGKLESWGVSEENFTYDLNGLGQLFKGFFPRAVPFVNNEAVEPKLKYVYANLKSQAAYVFASKIVEGELCINPDLLNRRYSGHGYSNLRLCDILLNERKILRADPSNTNHGFALPKKAVMKRLVGHSPDFIEAMMMAMIFIIKKKKRNFRGLGLL